MSIPIPQATLFLGHAVSSCVFSLAAPTILNIGYHRGLLKCLCLTGWVFFLPSGGGWLVFRLFWEINCSDSCSSIGFQQESQKLVIIVHYVLNIKSWTHKKEEEVYHRDWHVSEVHCEPPSIIETFPEHIKFLASKKSLVEREPCICFQRIYASQNSQSQISFKILIPKKGDMVHIVLIKEQFFLSVELTRILKCCLTSSE